MPLEKWLRTVKLFNVQWKSKIIIGCCLICSVSPSGKMLQLKKKGIEDSYVIHKGTILKNFKNHKEQHKNGQRDFFDDCYVMLKAGKSTINR